MVRSSFTVCAILAIALFATIPAHAVAIGAVVCLNGSFPCNAVWDSGLRLAGPAVLPFNSYVNLPFAFQDAQVTFTGSILVVDRLRNGLNSIYAWGTGVAQDNNGVGVGFYLDIGITQTYQTVPAGNWAFGEANIGTCNAGAVLNSNVNAPPGPGSASGSVVEGVVNGNGLPVLAASCGGALPFNLHAGPFGPVAIGNLTNLTSYGQFFFNPGAAPGLNQAIDLPWGDDFPDPTFANGDFPTLQDLINDPLMVNVTPEPGTWLLLAGSLGVLSLVRRKRA